MKTKHTAALLSLILLAAAATPARADGSVNAILGGRVLKHEAFLSPVDHPAAVGVVADFGLGPTLPLFLSVSGLWSLDRDGDTGTASEASVDIGELGLGLKLMPQSGMVRPYLGGGTLRTWVQEKRNAETLSDSDTGRGWYADAGATVWIGRHFDLGANIRWITDTDVTLYGVRGDLDSRVYGLVVGFTWGEGAPRRHHRGRD